MTAAAQKFVTPLAVGALAADHVYVDLFSREDEQDVGHIRLARDCDLIVVAPATADLMSKMANGLADDLASTVLLATDRPVLIAPAMNPKMWQHAATRRNAETLRGDGIRFIGPATGEMAESGEAGAGRMCEPLEIVAAIEAMLDGNSKAPQGPQGDRHVRPDTRTHRSRPLHRQPLVGAAGPCDRGRPRAARGRCHARVGSGLSARSDGLRTVHVERAEEMLDAVLSALPADIAVMVAAVADWRVATSADQKIKKKPGEAPAPAAAHREP